MPAMAQKLTADTFIFQGNRQIFKKSAGSVSGKNKVNLTGVAKLLVADFGCFDGSLFQPIQFAARFGIGGYLAVPIIVLPRMKQCFQLAPFLGRELVNRFLDFRYRLHDGNVANSKPTSKRRRGKSVSGKEKAEVISTWFL
jgi:hypothetical protein